jgi:hypothetical protein
MTHTGEQQVRNHLGLTDPLRAWNAGWGKRNAVRMTAGDGWGEASCGTLIGTIRLLPEPSVGLLSGYEGWNKIDFRLGVKLSRGIMGRQVYCRH